MIKEAIIKIVTKQDLTFSEAETVMNEIMSGKTTATQNAAFLAALSTKSTKAETIDEISGCAVSMRSHATPVEHPGMDVLEIVGTERGGAEDDEGYVSFVARYSANGQACEHREKSYFKKIDGAWRFIDGEIEKNKPFHREEPKIGRNDPCPCGSGKKYKKCCGKGK